ncbi:hypothetical protein BHE74_00056362 [Ensete ventricosum]|nr:hypothetical protein BHE74_00056362 [Ensete ventricosum]
MAAAPSLRAPPLTLASTAAALRTFSRTLVLLPQKPLFTSSRALRSPPLPPFRSNLPARRLATRAGANGGNGSVDPRQFDFDLFTIGAGSGGVRASRFAATYGAKVAICELPFSTISSESAGGVGGTCVLRGCVPKKLLVYSSKYSHEFEESRGFGWTYEADPMHDWSTLIANKNAELQRLTGIYKNILQNSGVTLIEGRGKIVDPHTVDVDGKHYTARHILISVGGRPNLPDIPGIEHAIDSDAALDLPSKPEKIAIVGGGYIALEFAGIFTGLKSEVHVFIRQKKVLRGFDEEVRNGLFVYDRAVPSAVFSQPPIGQVGLTEEQVRQFLLAMIIRPLKATLSGLPDRVFMKLILTRLDFYMLQGIAIAVKAGLTKADFDSTVGIHPTSAEELVTMRSPTRKIRKDPSPAMVCQVNY